MTIRSSDTSDTSDDARTAPADPLVGGQTLAHVVRAETIKLTSVRSTWALLASGATFTLLSGGLSALSAVMRARAEGRPGAGFDAVSASTTGVSTLAFLVGVLGILQVTGELTTGLGRTTFTAVPRRGIVVGAKAVALALLTVPVAAVATALTFAIAQGVLGSQDLGVPVLSLDSAQVVLGAAGYAVAVGFFGQALAWLLRSTIGAAFALLGVLSLLGPLLGLLPAQVSGRLVQLLPGEAAAALVGADPSGASLSGLVAAPVTVVWCAAALLGAALLLRRRDS